MNGHVPPSATGGGEHHVAAPALEHLVVVMRGQVSVEAAAAEGFAYCLGGGFLSEAFFSVLSVYCVW